ncbi:MAG: D-2-hydroxyacid dehydrogenase [Anaerolineae bacterium]
MEDRITVLVTPNVSEQVIQQLQEISPRLNIIHFPAHAPGEIPPDVWDEVEVLYTWDVLPPKEVAPRLRWVQVLSAGVDDLVDNPLFAEHDILLTTASGIHAVAMAEYALGMMLAFAHRLPEMVESKRKHEWPSDKAERFTPQLLRGATLGIVGYGSIGREVARLARAFGMEVLATKRDVMHPNSSDEYVEPGTGDPEGTLCHRLYPAKALKSMVQECDYVVLLTPRTPETHNLLDAETIASMKPGAVLVNLARGGLVDEEALVKALQSGALRGAAFDVFAEEPLPEDSPLWDVPNLIISPHIAGLMPDYIHRATEVFEENLRRYLSERDLLNVVDWERGY